MASYISPFGYQKIVDEYDFLVNRERPRITAEVGWAASLGDRSENSEYIYGKQRLREIDRRLRFLRERLDKLTPLDPMSFEGDRITFGATADIEDEDGKHQTWTILGEDEVDLKAGVISYVSPIGKALLGKAVGESATFQSPGGAREVYVLAVRREPRPAVPTPEAVGDKP